MRFPAEFIERVRDANNIVDLVSAHTQLKSMAGGYMGRCPFPDHAEKTPSFSVSESKQVYYCFGCHKKGNIFRFVQDLQGLGFPEAVEYLANRANISLPENTADTTEQDLLALKKKELLKVSSLAAKYFVEQFKRLPEAHPAKVYALKKRGLTSEIITDFQVGYATDEWDGLVKYLQSKGASMAIAEEARLVKARKEGNGYFDIFRERLMFPIFNVMGEPIAFGGRIILSGEPKYLNSGDSPIFTKGRVLYGLAQTAKYIRSEDQVIVVEGYMDLVSLYQSGIKNVVATMGTALTPDHGKIFSRMTKNVAVLFDGDEAGQHAAERSLPILLGADLHPKGLILPENQDPDDFVKASGVESLRGLLAQAPDLFSMVLGMWLRGYRHEASEKVKLSDMLKPVFGAIRDLRLKSLYISQGASRLGVEENWLKNAVSGGPQNDTRVPFSGSKTPLAIKPSTPEVLTQNSAPTATDGVIVLKGCSRPEQMLLSLGLKNRNNFNKIMSSEVTFQVTHPGVRQVLEDAALTYRQDPEKFDKLAGLLTSFVDEPDLLFAYDKSYAQEETTQEMETSLLLDCIKRVREQNIQVQVEQLTAEIRTNPSSEKLERLMTLQRDRQELRKIKSLDKDL